MTDSNGTPPQEIQRVAPQSTPFTLITTNCGHAPDGQALVMLELSLVTGACVLIVPAAYLPQLAKTIMTAYEEAPKIQVAPANAVPRDLFEKP